jgi:hypothetical protein
MQVECALDSLIGSGKADCPQGICIALKDRLLAARALRAFWMALLYCIVGDGDCLVMQLAPATSNPNGTALHGPTPHPANDITDGYGCGPRTKLAGHVTLEKSCPVSVPTALVLEMTEPIDPHFLTNVEVDPDVSLHMLKIPSMLSRLYSPPQS